MRVVIDTNVFVSSFFGGLPRKIVDLWKQGGVTWCISRDILNEYMAVLVRMGLTGEKEMAELLQLFGKGVNVLFAANPPVLKIVQRDPDDDKFIECAVALKAQCIVTGDKDLLVIKEYAGIAFRTPREFLSGHRASDISEDSN